MISALLSSLLAAAAPRVAVLPARGGDDTNNRDAQAAIVSALRGRVDVIDGDALAHLIASAAGSGLSCDTSLPECATRIGAFGGLDFVVTTQLNGSRAALALNDCSDGHEVRKKAALLAPQARPQGFAALARAVVGDGDAQGQIAIANAGVLSVDGVEHAGPATLTVAVGPHEIEWRPARGPAHTQTVEVPAAATASVSFADHAGDDGALAGTSALAVGGIAIGGVVAVAGGVGAFIAAPGDRARYSAHDYNDAVTLGRVLLGVAAGGAVLAVVAGGALVLGADLGGDRGGDLGGDLGGALGGAR